VIVANYATLIVAWVEGRYALQSACIEATKLGFLRRQEPKARQR